MIKIGRIYTSESGERFLIHSRKRKSSSNGCNFIGEHTGNGLITYFNHTGVNSFRSDWNLQVDSYKWCGVRADGELAAEGFVPREELVEEFPGYLRMEDNNPTTIIYMTRAGLEAVYA